MASSALWISGDVAGGKRLLTQGANHRFAYFGICGHSMYRALCLRRLRSGRGISCELLSGALRSRATASGVRSSDRSRPRTPLPLLSRAVKVLRHPVHRYVDGWSVGVALLRLNVALILAHLSSSDAGLRLAPRRGLAQGDRVKRCVLSSFAGSRGRRCSRQRWGPSRGRGPAEG